MKKRRIVVCVLAALSVLLIATGGYKYWQGQQVYRIGNSAYDKLRSQVSSDQTGATTGQDAPQGTFGTMVPVRQVDVPDHPLDYTQLNAINPDIIGWLYCPDTMVDYPVAASEDYDYYINHLPDGSENANGTLFLDYHAKRDFSDRFNIIYGHHMASGAMFGTLTFYKQQSHYDAHPYWYLYTENGNYRVDLVYGFVIAEKDWRGDTLIETKNQDELLSYAKENTTFKTAVELKDDQRYIAFSTCSYEYYNARYVVIGYLTPEFILQSVDPQ